MYELLQPCLSVEVHLAHQEMNILLTAAMLTLSTDEFLPHNPCLSLWASEGIVFVYSQAFFHQEYTRQCGEREREMEKSGAIWGMEKKGNTIMQMVQASKASLCVCVSEGRLGLICY